MNPANYRVRRATVDDLPVLRRLWETMRLNAAELEKRLKEFQIAENGEGKILGALAFQMEGRHGCIRGEAFEDFAVADEVRPLFWNRIQSLSLNHGVARLWTQENAPFWSRNGLQPAPADALQRLPESWNRAAPGWLTLRLRDEDAVASADKEFALFVESEKRRSEEALGQARRLKTAITIFALLIAFALAGLALYFFITRRPPAQ